MSDDTPTQRFDATPATPGQTPAPTPPAEKKSSRGVLIALIVLGAVLLIAIIVLLALLLNGNGTPTAAVSPSTSGSPAAASTPSVTPSVPTEPTPTPAASATSGGGTGGGSTATGATFTTFSPGTTVKCYKSDAPNFTPPPVPIDITWATARAASAWFVQGTSDAADSKYMEIPVKGNQSNFQFEVDFPCYQLNATYTITLVGTDGKHVSKSWTVKNVGDHN